MKAGEQMHFLAKNSSQHIVGSDVVIEHPELSYPALRFFHRCYIKRFHYSHFSTLATTCSLKKVKVNENFRTAEKLLLVLLKWLYLQHEFNLLL